MRPKILVVDDNGEFRAAVIQFLESQGVELDIEQAGTGELAVEMARVNKPEIVLMDLRLPKVNGIDAANQIKEDNPACDIILTTMFKVEDFKKAYAKDKIVAFIPKNEVYDRLMPVIRKCLATRGISTSRPQ